MQAALENVMAAHGLYAQLYDEQFAGGQVEARCDDGVVFADGAVMAYNPAGVRS